MAAASKRILWKGAISFGPVHIPIALHSAAQDQGLDFDWLDKQGLPDLQTLQNAFDTPQARKIIYYLFDLPFCNGMDLRQAPLTERRKELEGLLKGSSSPVIRFSDTFILPGAISSRRPVR